jgi:tetratricopeptide (TPR) repeat protein
MKIKDNTHELIKILTKSEKRYVQLFASTHKKDSELSKLFSIMENMEEYDESFIVNEFEGKQIHVIKNRLNALILKSMRSYHTKSSVEAELLALIMDANFLYDRGLYAQSYKLVKKGIDLATEFEKFNFLLELLEMQQRIDGKDLNLVSFFDSIKESKKVLGLINNLLDSRNDAFKIYDLVVRLGSIMSSEEADKYKEQLENQINKEFKEPLSFKAVYFLNSALAMSFNLLGDFEKYYQHYEVIIKAMESKPSLIKDLPSSYIGTNNNLINALFALKRYDEIPAIIEKIRKLQVDLKMGDDTYIASKIFLLSYDAELTLYIQTGEYEKGVEILPEIIERIKLYKEKKLTVHLLDVYYQIAYLYFGVDDYRNSLKWLNKILNESETNLREDLQCMGRIFNLILHIELNNQLILEYVLDQSARFLNKKKRLYHFEKTVFTYLKQIIKIKEEDKKDKVCREFKVKLEEISKDIFVQRALSYFDMVSWVESKISKKPYREIVKAQSLFKTLI